MEFAEVIAIALGLPGVEELPFYGSPAWKRDGRAFMAPGREPGAFTVKLDWETHDRLLAERPEVYFKTPHYERSPWLLVRLDPLERDEARALIEAAWADAPNKAKSIRSR